jgi:hypothetical protein
MRRGKEYEFYVETHLTDAHNTKSAGEARSADSDDFLFRA